MSPRAACRLETLGFEHVYDYVNGKADWLGHGLPREGDAADVPTAGDLVDTDLPTCALSDDLTSVRAKLEEWGYGFCVVVSEGGVVLGRVRSSALGEREPETTAESVMEPGPGTVRPGTRASELIDRLAKKNLKSAIVTTPGGRLVGVFKRADAERRLAAEGT